MVDKRTESFVRELQREFLKQEENNKEQLENMKATNNQIVELLKQLSQNTNYQNNSIEMFTKILSKMNNINPIAFAEAAADSRISIWSRIKRIFRRSKMK
jgi:negative regulator of replication initiation